MDGLTSLIAANLLEVVEVVPVECTNIPLPMTSHTFSCWDTNWKDALPLPSDVMEPRSPTGWGDGRVGGRWRGRWEGTGKGIVK